MLENMAVFFGILYVLSVGIAGLASVFIFSHKYYNDTDNKEEKLAD